MKLSSDYFAEEIEKIEYFREKLNWKSVKDVDKFLVELIQYLKDAERIMMKKICRNCRWHNRRYDGVAEKSVCCHLDIHEEIKGEHIYNGEKLEYTKTNRLIEGNYIVAQIKPPWCPGFEAKPEEMPEEMADKIFGSGEDEDNTTE